MKRVLRYLYLLFTTTVLLSSIACKKNEESVPQNFIPAEASDLSEEELKTIHHDTNYQYEYRTGEAGNYEYNYDVSGTDYEGNEVSGTVFVNGKYGFGTITNARGEEIEIETEWIGKGILKGTDSQENEYNLEVD